MADKESLLFHHFDLSNDFLSNIDGSKPNTLSSPNSKISIIINRLDGLGWLRSRNENQLEERKRSIEAIKNMLQQRKDKINRLDNALANPNQLN